MDSREAQRMTAIIEEVVKRLVLPAAKDEARAAAVEMVDSAVKYHMNNLAMQFRLTKFHRIGPVEFALRRAPKPVTMAKKAP